MGLDRYFWRIGRIDRGPFPAGRKTLHVAGKRFPIPENVADFATRRVLAHISENLSFYVVSSKFRHAGRLGRGAFPPSRGTLHMARGVSRFRKTFPDSGKSGRFSDPNGYSRYARKFKILCNSLGISAHRPTSQEDIST